MDEPYFFMGFRGMTAYNGICNDPCIMAVARFPLMYVVAFVVQGFRKGTIAQGHRTRFIKTASAPDACPAVLEMLQFRLKVL